MTMAFKLEAVEDAPTPPEQQSRWIQREVERLLVNERYEDGYALYLTDPTITNPDDFDTFVSLNS